MTRITHRSIQESTLGHLQRNLSAMATIQEQLSTQKRINRPSDDPTGTVDVLQLRSDLRATEQHRRSIDDGTGWLNSADRALTTSTTTLTGVKVLAIAALNTGAQSASSREAMALEIEGLRDELVAQANTSYLGRSVFAGTSGPGAAVTVGAGPPRTYTWASTGTGTVERRVASDTSVRVDVEGPAVFGEGGDTVFALLDTIAAQVRAGDPALSASLGELGERFERVTAAHSQVGARAVRLDTARQAADDRELAVTTSLSEVESIDLPATIVALQSQEVAYRAALGATAKVLQPSLMDFLR